MKAETIGYIFLGGYVLSQVVIRANGRWGGRILTIFALAMIPIGLSAYRSFVSYAPGAIVSPRVTTSLSVLGFKIPSWLLVGGLLLLAYEGIRISRRATLAAKEHNEAISAITAAVLGPIDAGKTCWRL